MATVCFYCVLCGARLEADSESPSDLMECHACTRHVPVPTLANVVGNAKAYPPVLPPEVLELNVVFQCAGCSARLSADARWEGREATCPQCSTKVGIPRWSAASRRARAPGTKPAHGIPPVPVTQPEIDLQAARLSAEEIAFLSEPASSGEGAAA